MLNELVIFTATVSLVAFTPAFNISPSTKDKVGYFILYLVVMITLVDLLL